MTEASAAAMMILASLAAFPAFARDPPAPAASERLEEALSRVRARRGDLDVRPGRWDTRFTQPPIEELLSDPVALADRSSEWGGRLAAADGAAAFCAFGGSLLGLPTESPRSAAVSTAAAGGLGPPLADVVGDLAVALARARPFLSLAAAGLSAKDRERLTAGFMAQLRRGPAERLDPALFDLAARFDAAALWQALRGVAEAADRAAAALAAAPAPQGTLPRSLVVAGSTFTLGGAGDDAYAEEELAASAVVLDLGGSNRYLGAPAAAGPGEVKVVLDLGSEVVVESSGPAATGRFGIGLMALPNAGGPKRLRGGPFSLGAGLFGAGVLRARGAASSFESGDFSQGAAAFGLGVLDAEGADSSFVAPMGAQGFAFTGGVGLFRAKGARARLECGLVYPDPRDEVAALSLCQGVGYGPRAFAAGGFGLARVESDGAQLDANYFAQGAGYWHSFGGFYFAGDGARIQSRRYGQGAGIHTAAGAFELEGSRNRLLHWGVGPGFGWDWGAGFAAVRGAGNEVYSEWASGKGDVNGHGFAVIEGEGSRIRLGEGGAGTFRRGAPSYGVVVVSGTAVSYWLPRLSSPTAMGAALVSSLWGTVANDGGATLDAGLSFEAPRWRPMQREREEAARADREVNAARLAEADLLPAQERLARWLFLASEGGLDGRTPGEALNRLLSLPDAEAALLPALVAPERFDELVYLRTVIPAYGARLVPALEAAAASASGVRKALLLGFLRSGPAEAGMKAAAGLKRERDWRVRREALGLLGSLFDHSQGEEPGRLAFLEETLALCKRQDPKAPLAQETIERIGQKRLSDLLAALALDPETGAGDRLELLLRAPDPFNPVSADGLNAYAAIWGRRPEACRRAVERELKDAKRLEPQARERLLDAAKEASPDLLPVALIGLGQLGWSKDAQRLAQAFDEDTAAVREAAASGLGRMGKAAEGQILAALRAAPAVRALAVAAAAQSSDAGVFHLLARGFDDPVEGVRLAAIGGLSAAQIPNHRLRKDFVPSLDRLASSDPSASVRASAACAAANFR